MKNRLIYDIVFWFFMGLNIMGIAVWAYLTYRMRKQENKDE